MQIPEQRLIALDGLRGMAALMVLVSHFSNETHVFRDLLGYGTGKLGVLLFFVLSGFLMGWLYREQPFTWPNVLDFARRRFARIAPLFITVLVLTFILYHTPLRQFVAAPMPTRGFFETLFLWHGKGIFWTIPVEVQFYAVFPLVWLASATLPRLWLPLTTFVVVMLLAVVKVKYPVLLNFGAAFFVGVILASLKTQPTARVTNAVFLVSLIGLVLLLPGVWKLAGMRPWDSFKSPLHLLVAGGLAWSAIRAPIANSVLGSRPARFLGDISFSLYLLHYMVLMALAASPLATSRPLFFVVFLALSIGLAAMSHRILEAPARRWLSGSKTLSPPISAGPQASQAPAA